MIKLNSPELLFDKHKLYVHLTNVGKNEEMPHINDDTQALVLYAAKNSEITDAQKEMLDKMMVACKFTPNQVQYMNVNGLKVALGQLFGNKTPKLVLLFGKLPLSGNLGQLAKHHPVTLGGVNVILTEQLDKLEVSNADKKALWETLKMVLNIK
jgi:hypothetical protein